MSTFTFNDICSDELGLIVTKTPIPPCQQESHETIYIPGGTPIYKNKDIRENVGIYINTTVIEPDRLREIYSTYQGRGKLILSNEPDKYYKAVCRPLTPENIFSYMNNITFEFECEPFAYAVSNDPVTITSDDYALEVGGNFYSQPLYKIYGNGNITLQVNGEPFLIYDVNEYVEVDASLLMCHKNGANVRNLGFIPFLNVGTNHIEYEGNVEKIEITKNERWL